MKAKDTFTTPVHLLQLGNNELPEAIGEFASGFMFMGYGKNISQVTFPKDFRKEVSFNVSDGSRTDSSYNQGDIEAIFPFKDGKRFDHFIELKDETFLANIVEGGLYYISNGANYYDQGYGQMIEVTAVRGTKIYLKRPLLREYTLRNRLYYGSITNEFSIPKVGETVVLDGVSLPDRSGMFYDISGNIFMIKKSIVKGKQVEFLNIGRGNQEAGAVIPADAKVTDGGFMFKIEKTSGAVFKGFTLIAPPDRTVRLWRSDNSYETTMEDVRIVVTKDSPKDQNLATFFLDAAYGGKYIRCEFNSVNLYSSQISRGSARNKFTECEFNNVRLDLSEFCVANGFFDCDFNFTQVDGSNSSTAFIILGDTTDQNSFKHCKFYATGSSSTKLLFYDGEVKGAKSIDNSYQEISNCQYFLGGSISNVFPSKNTGLNVYKHNTIIGRVRSVLFRVRASNSKAEGNMTRIANNEFRLEDIEHTSTNDPLIDISGNCILENNYFEFLMPDGYIYKEFNKYLIRINGMDLKPTDKIIIRNNKWNGFPINKNHIYFRGIDRNDPRIVIENNMYYNNISVDGSNPQEFKL